MNFKLKALAAAVALAAVAGQASAGTNNTIGTQASGGSNVLFYAIDTNTNTSFVEDLTSSVAGTGNDTSFAYNTSQTFSLGSAFSQVSSADIAAGDIQWGVVSGRYVSGTAGNEDFTTTLNSSLSPYSAGELSLSDPGSVTAVASGSGKLGVLINANTAASLQSANGYYSTSGSTNASNMLLSGLNFGLNSTNLLATNGLNQAAQYIQLTSGTANSATPAAGSWNFDGSSITYTVAAVPEPETYGMLAAGLLMLGVVARRRKA